MHQIVCSICSEKIISNVVNDNTLGSVLIELATHASKQHPKEYREYGNSLEMLLQVIPAYQLLESFVDYEATEKLSSETARLIADTEEIISNALNQVIEIEATQEIPIELCGNTNNNQ